MQIIRKIFDVRGAPLLAIVFVTLFVVEGKRQLRKRVQPRSVRLVRNTLLSLPAFALLRFMLVPVMVRIAYGMQGKKSTPMWPGWTRQVLAFLLLDYSNYLWHILNHKLPILWRFHLVHHTDPDLDLATAIRFHFGEMIGSVFFRGACVALTRATPATVLYYEIFFEAATQFHHSNMKLPFITERALNYIIVTPRMHGIHHSVIREETDSNYSVIFSFWDRIHRTIRLNVPQGSIVTGVPSYSDPDELTVAQLLALPFGNIRKWQKSSEIRTDSPPSISHNHMAE